MSAVLILPSTPGRDLAWESHGGLHQWVLEFLADRIGDADAEEFLRRYLAGGYRFFALEDLGAEPARRAALLLRDQLPAFADADADLTEGGRELVGELVALASQWCSDHKV